jgi:hypothetical protein
MKPGTLVLLASALLQLDPVKGAEEPDPAPTFNKTIAPIIFQHCAPCHRPGQAGPFNLLGYADVKKHAADIVSATQKRYMPPWLPEPGCGDFLDERRLAADKIELIKKWFAAGAAEGAPSDLPPLPKWTDEWFLGPPDLIVTLPQTYTLGAEGKDVYRNFVVPVPLTETRFVKALEFRPNSKAVHHARILIDTTRQARRLEAQESEPGFGGMSVPARFPPGQLLTWAPGTVPSRRGEELPWAFEAGSDVVLQMHLQRTGRPETVGPTIGIYFTDSAPKKFASLLGLMSQVIEIPPGATNYVVQRSLTLPADVDLLAVMPHAHYLGKEVRGYATLPGGEKRCLLSITNWDFNWQGEYRYRNPLFLPKGSVISMEWRLDNSSDNPRNPNHPPKKIVYGPQSTDEMAELWLQVLPRDQNELTLLNAENRRVGLVESVAYFENALRTNPTNAIAHSELGKNLGPLGREEEAFEHFKQAADLNGALAEPHYFIGLMLFNRGRMDEARTAFENAIRRDANYLKAHDGLGLIAMAGGDFAGAEKHFRNALRLNPDDAAAKNGLARALKAKGGADPGK